MAIAEVSEKQWLALRRIHLTEALFFFTPLCGTCKVAEQMLEVVAATPNTLPVVKMNINFAPVLRERWKISSVPALVLLRDGEPLRIEYAMRSVGDLFEWLRIR